MVYDAFKKLVFLLAILIISFVSAHAQINKKEFSNDYNKYLKELSDFMLASDNSDLKNNYKRFKKISSEDYLSKSNKTKIVSISNKMLKKRYKASTHFNNFILSIIAQNQKNVSNDKLSNWLDVVSSTLDEYSSKKLLVFFYFTLDLVNENILRETKTTKWSISSNNFDYCYIFCFYL